MLKNTSTKRHKNISVSVETVKKEHLRSLLIYSQGVFSDTRNVTSPLNFIWKECTAMPFVIPSSIVGTMFARATSVDSIL